ncbi:hypothetical protein GCM10007390_14410 [Persicitalea jodogahamensis]|uniref:Uncharacterized protein n=1 Tax=Persicitalea jodogahamensis TaxID=402147 RepID=A0A8J3G999_9BACT|nr:hypothetical protein GCM10007390_14410 [Persicitalea jodogahamensis]
MRKKSPDVNLSITMKLPCIITFCLLGLFSAAEAQKNQKDVFPDGTPMSGWFLDHTKVKLGNLGKQYVITDFGAKRDSNLIQTVTIQKVIDEAAREGGGVVVIPKGTFLSGALFFKPKTHLYVADGGKLKGSDDIADYPAMPSRMEGQNLDYFPALVNA